jgi:Glycosyltransferase like family
VIAFATSITDVDVFNRCAAPGVRLAAEPDSKIMAFNATGSIFRSYNLLLDQARGLEGLEALVIVHQDAEIVDPDFCAKLREKLADPDVGVVGCVGALGVRSIAWWEGSATWASFSHRYSELGGGEIESLSWNPDDLPPYAQTGEVETVDGFVLALPPWTVHNVRFDESLGQLHGYDLDFCLQVREAGRKVVTADLRVIHHHSLDLVSDPEGWIEAHMRVAEKWDGRMPHVGSAPGDWKQRARRAEAEAAAAKIQFRTSELLHEAHLRQLDRDLREMTESVSWRITEPLRRLNARRRALRPGR